MDKSLWQTLSSSDSLHSSHNWSQAVLSCGKHDSTLSIRFIPRLRFCWGLWSRREFLYIFGSRPFVSISWMCKKQTSVSHGSTELEVISLDAGLRMDWISILELWDVVIEVLHSSENTHPHPQIKQREITVAKKRSVITHWQVNVAEKSRAQILNQDYKKR